MDKRAADNLRFDVVAVAASAGGVAAVSALLAALPADFPAAILVVQHLDPMHRSHLVDILSRRTQLRVKQAEDGDVLCPSTVFVAPPGSHLEVGTDGTLRLTHGAAVNFVRPSADLLFRSVAERYGERAIAVVLTGEGHDAADGVRAIKERAGTVIVEEPGTAQHRSMPAAAIRAVPVDLVAPLDDISAALATLVTGGPTP
jgi:two-component system chemotaxis response regulator CheB